MNILVDFPRQRRGLAAPGIEIDFDWRLLTDSLSAAPRAQ